MNASMDAVEFAKINEEVSSAINKAETPDEKARAVAAGNVRLAEAQQVSSAKRTQEEVDTRRKALEDAKEVELHTKARMEALEHTAKMTGKEVDYTPLKQAIADREVAEKELTIAENKQKEETIRAATNVANAKAA